MAFYDAVPIKFRYRERGAASWNEVDGFQLGGDSGVDLANPTEDSARGITRNVGELMNVNMVIKANTEPGTYQELYLAAPNPADADPDTDTDVSGTNDWTKVPGRIQGGQNPDWTPNSVDDAEMRPIFRSVAFDFSLNIEADTSLSAESILSTHHDSMCAVAFRRTDGTFRIYDPVHLYFNTVPDVGPSGAVQHVVNIQNVVKDITAISNITGTHLTNLNTLQLAGKPIEAQVDFQSGTVTFDKLGFTAVPLELFGDATLEGVQLNGVGYGLTQGSVATYTTTP